ncbi:MAG: leucine-rich repeat protein [Prevotella sp.]|nr:leucine-rich repeat protein [Prevotella sp.]
MVRDLVIPDGVTVISNWAFYNSYSYLTSVTIPNSVTSIGNGAFWNCTGLTSIDIPNSVTSLCESAFQHCSNLTSITIPNSVTSIGKSVFQNCSNLTSITIPNSVTSIESSAFADCTSLASINIPNSVKSIGISAFQKCSSLTSITIPNSVTSIGNSAFEACYSLTSIDIPNSVTSIGNKAFRSCTKLTSATIGKGVTSIGEYAFSGCSNLTSVTVKNPTPITITEYAFTNRGNATLYVPLGSKSKYDVAKYWMQFNNIIEMDFREEQSLTLDSLPNMTYGDPTYTLPKKTAQDLTLTWTSSNSSVATFDGNVLTVKGAGTATITATQNGNDDYKPYTKEYTLTVAKAPLTITAKSYNIFQGDALPAFEAEFSGFKNNETYDVLTTQPSFLCNATSTSTPGTYDIIVSGAASDNYDIAYVNGTLTIEDTIATITTLTIPASGMTTFCPANDLDLSGVTDFKAYVIVSYNKKTNKVVAVEVDEAPAGTGLYIEGKPGTYQMNQIESGSSLMNMLKGVTATTTIPATEDCFTNLIPYTLASTTIFIAASNGSRVAANTAYLQIETAKYNGQPAEILKVSNGLLGDINKDGDVSIIDVVTLVNMLLGKE